MTSLAPRGAPSRLARWLPFLAWRPLLRAGAWRTDLVAGLTVALVMVPQSLAYAQLAGLPPHIGLYAALLPSVVGALFGSLPQISTGPVALTGMLTAASLAPLAAPGSSPFLALAVALALLAGLLQLGMGALGLGWLLRLLSHPVMSGFTNAAAILIGFSQLPALLGLPASGPWLERLTQPHPLTALFGLGALLSLLALRRFAPRWPGVLIVVAAATVLSHTTGLADTGGAVVGAIPPGLPDFAWPVLALPEVPTLLPAAFVIALVSFMEVTASARIIAARNGQIWDENQELIGQGLAKIAAAASGAMPVSSSFSRTALALQQGARTGLAPLVCSATVLATLLFLAPLLWHLPRGVLAAIILVAVLQLVDVPSLVQAWRASRDDGLAAGASFAATLAFAPNIQNGILTGLLLSLALLIYREMNPRVALLGLHPDGTYRDAERFGLPHPHPQLVILRFDGPLNFVNAAAFEAAVGRATRAQPDVRVVLLSAAAINTIDASGIHVLAGVSRRMAQGGIQLAFCGLKKQVIDALERTGLWPGFAPNGAFRTEQQALEALTPGLGTPLESASPRL